MSSHRLRCMNKSDLGQVLQWRNAFEVRRFMYTNHEIGLDEHCNWFAKVSDDPLVSLLIYEHHGHACGFVNITCGSCQKIGDWGFYLSPNAHKGAGKSMGKKALGFAFDELGLHKVCGQALGFNERSVAFHKALGFTLEGRLRDQHFDGNSYHDIVCFGLLDDEWELKVEDGSDE